MGWGKSSRVIHSTPLHPQKLTVKCVIWCGGVIEPYFFENIGGLTVVITNSFWNEIEDIDVEDMSFQQDGANLNVLHEQHRCRIISRSGDVSWPPRLCDLIPTDFLLWSLKSFLSLTNLQRCCTGKETFAYW